jgi:hypothetical protein
MPVRLAHEIVAEMHQEDPKTVLTRYRDPEDLELPMFSQHPVVVEHGIDDSVPVTLYSDSTPCRAKMKDRVRLCPCQILQQFIILHGHMPGSVQDSFHACYISVPWPEAVRYLCFIVLKSMLCKCGCGGRCTLMPLYRVLCWSLNSGS